MNARAVLSLVNLAAIVTAFVVLFELPQYAQYAFYGLLAWIAVGFVLMYVPGVGRPSASGAASAGPLPSADPTGGATFPSGATAASARPLDFCIYCGTTLASGASACSACGHRVPAM